MNMASQSVNSIYQHTSEQHRIVVTGMGLVTTIGDTYGEYFDAVVAGRSGIAPWKSKDCRLYSKFGGDMSDFDFEAQIERVGKA